MTPLRYNFDPLTEVAESMIYEYEAKCTLSNKVLAELQREINKFFRDSTCKGVIFTDNDGLFFGVHCHPEITPAFISTVLEYGSDADKLRITEYRLEIDSKIFSSVLDITPGEIVAMLLHDIGHIVNDSSLVESLADEVSLFAAKNHCTVRLPDSGKERSLAFSILKYGMSSTIRKMTSMFVIYKNGEVIADHFVYEYGYLDELQSLLKKVSRNALNVNNTVPNKLIALTWALRLVINITFQRNTAVHYLMDVYRVTVSKLDKIIIKDCMTKLKMYSTESDATVVNVYECAMLGLNQIEEQNIIEESHDSQQRKIAKRKAAVMQGVRHFEEDYYTYVMEARSLGDKSDALYVLRQVNQHISVMEDILDSYEVTGSERKWLFDMIDKYKALRFDLANNSKFKFNYTDSVITINYPEIS